uniref:Uncharacterized protein n=1 Tax=Arundo donax TaxID=35708 RepID=A0A0A9CNP9_ARUDO
MANSSFSSSLKNLHRPSRSISSISAFPSGFSVRYRPSTQALAVSSNDFFTSGSSEFPSWHEDDNPS